jgi:hypothetical protein
MVLWGTASSTALYSHNYTGQQQISLMPTAKYYQPKRYGWIAKSAVGLAGGSDYHFFSPVQDELEAMTLLAID